MRTRPILAALAASAFLVACGSTVDQPVRGTVVDMEHEPAKTCPPKKKKSKPCTPKQECYELDILLDYSGDIVEVCDKAAYMVLDTRHNNRYSSDIDYSREEH